MTIALHHHDYRPGRFALAGQRKPSALLAAEKAADDAWDRYYESIEMYVIDRAAGDQPDPTEMNELRQIAQEAEEHKRRLYDRWQSL